MSRRSRAEESDEDEEDSNEADEETEESLASQINRLQMIMIKKNLCAMIQDRGFVLPEEDEVYLESEPEELMSNTDPDFEMVYSTKYDEDGNPIGKMLRTTLLLKTDNKAINKQDADNLIKIYRGEKGDPIINNFIIVSNVKAHRLGSQKLAQLMSTTRHGEGPFVQIFRFEDLLYDPSKHFYQSKFSVLTEDERAELDADGITTASLPVIKYTDLVDEVNESSERRKNLFCDPIVRRLGLRTNVILKEEAKLFAVSFLNPDYLNFLITRR